MKKFLSVVLAFLMLAVMLPTTALADLAEGETCVAKIGERLIKPFRRQLMMKPLQPFRWKTV